MSVEELTDTALLSTSDAAAVVGNSAREARREVRRRAPEEVEVGTQRPERADSAAAGRSALGRIS